MCENIYEYLWKRKEGEWYIYVILCLTVASDELADFQYFLAYFKWNIVSLLCKTNKKNGAT